jgi:putative ABC transport system permease protein
MTTLTDDLRYALRQMRKSPIFALTAVLTLALGIGANTAIFTLLDQALLRSLPVRDPKQLTLLQFTGSDTGHLEDYGGEQGNYFSYPMYRDLAEKNSVFSGALATSRAQVGVVWQNHPELAQAEMVSGNYFDVLGVRPALGRLLVPSDDVHANESPVVVLSFAYWQRKFASNPGVLNQTILINAHPCTVIGVAGPGFRSVQLGYAPEMYVPMTMQPIVGFFKDDLTNRRSKWLNIVARVKPGLTTAQAEAGINPLWQSLRQDEFAQMSHSSEKFHQSFVTKSHLMLLDGAKGFSPARKELQKPLLVVMGMVALVMLMACANVASLLLVRAAGRVREMSIRYALGVERRRIAQQLLIEGLVLGLLGGSLGVLLAPAVSTVLQRKMLGGLDSDVPFSNHPDLRILLFNFALAFAVSVIFSLAPIAQFWKPNLGPALKQQAMTVAGGALRMRSLSVGVQIALSLLLMFGAGLFTRTLLNLKNTDVGFKTDHLLMFGLDTQLAGYRQEQSLEVYQRVLHALAAVPGARSVGGTSDPDLANDGTGLNITIMGYAEKDEEDMNVEYGDVSSSLFTTLQIPLAAGRMFTDADNAGGAPVGIVNESFARHYFGDASRALGHVFHTGGGKQDKATPLVTIVGVVKDVKHSGIRDEVLRTVYRPYLQDRPARAGMTFFVRTWQAPDTAAASIRHAMESLDSKLVPDNLQSMQAQIDDDLRSEQIIAMLAVSFGVLAMLLSAVGLYGVLAYSTAQRTREIGIRMALGSSRTRAAELVLREVMWLVVVSVAAAVPLALGLSRLVKSQLFGVSEHDPATLAIATLLIAVVALVAAVLPARRAASVDPMTALRYE